MSCDHTGFHDISMTYLNEMVELSHVPYKMLMTNVINTLQMQVRIFSILQHIQPKGTLQYCYHKTFQGSTVVNSLQDIEEEVY